MSTPATVDGVRVEDVAEALGPSAAERGARYARDGAVMFSQWHAGALQLRAVVRGDGSRVYSTIVSFDADGHGGLALVHGECSCPVGEMCQHVAAAALSAVPAGSTSAAPAAPTWESQLDALLGAGSGPADGAHRGPRDRAHPGRRGRARGAAGAARVQRLGLRRAAVEPDAAARGVRAAPSRPPGPRPRALPAPPRGAPRVRVLAVPVLRLRRRREDDRPHDDREPPAVVAARRGRRRRAAPPALPSPPRAPPPSRDAPR